MLTSGDIVDLDLGVPSGREAGFCHPAVVITAQRVLDAGPSVIQVVPLTSKIRHFGSEVAIEPREVIGLDRRSAAQCHHLRSVSTVRVDRVRGSVGPVLLARIREVIGVILDIPV